MDTAALTDVGERLDSFVDEVFSSLTRKDQRTTAAVYARGLMLDGRRKSMQPMAERLGCLEWLARAPAWLARRQFDRCQTCTRACPTGQATRPKQSPDFVDCQRH